MVRNIIEIYNKGVQGSAVASGSSVAASLGATNGEGKKVSKAQQDTAKATKQLSGKSWAKGLAKQIGVTFSVAALLKQSQVFTSTFGILFQMIGAIADVILAPALPYIMKAIIPLFKLGMNVGKSIGIIIKLGLEMTVKWIKFIDWMYTKFIPFYPEVKGLIKKFGDGTFIVELLQKFSNWYTKQIDTLIPQFQNIMEGILRWFKSILPGWLGGDGSDSSMPKVAIRTASVEVAKAVTAFVAPKILPEVGSDKGIALAKTSLGMSNLNPAGEMLNERMTNQGYASASSAVFGTVNGQNVRLLEGIKMDADMINAMKMNSTGYGSGNNTM